MRLIGNRRYTIVVSLLTILKISIVVGRDMNQVGSSDLDSQEQRVALQIITTDSSSGSPVTSYLDGRNVKQADGQNGEVKTISFDKQYNLMESQLDNHLRTTDTRNSGPQAESPRKIVISLNSLIANQTNGQNDIGPTRLTIGFAPEVSQQQESTRSIGPEKAYLESKSSDLSKVNEQDRSNHIRQNRPMRDVILGAVRKQGGVPAIIMKNGQHESIESMTVDGSRVPTIKFMLNTELLDNRSQRFDRKRGNPSLPEETNSLDDGLSGELSQIIDELDDQNMKRVLNHVHGSRRQSRQLRGGQNRIMESTNRHLDSLSMNELSGEFGGGSKRNRTTSSLQAPSRVTDKKELIGDFADLSSESMDSNSNQGLTINHDNKRSQFGFTKQQRQRLSSENKITPSDSNIGAHRWRQRDSESVDNSNSFDGQTIANNHDSSKNRPEMLFDDDSGNNNSNDRIQQANVYGDDGNQSIEESVNNSNDAKLLSNDKSASSSESSLDSASPRTSVTDRAWQSSKDRRMDEKVAKLLKHLKLYTTKDQLMKVARELENSASREKFQTQSGETETVGGQRISQGQKVARSTERKTISPDDSSRVSARHEIAASERREQSRGKIPAPLKYDLIDSLLDASNDIDAGESLEQTASNQVKSRRDQRLSLDKPGSDVLQRFQVKKQHLQTMREESDDELELNDAAGTNNDQLVEDTRLTQPDPADEFSEYTGTDDIVSSLKENERHYNGDTIPVYGKLARQRRANDEQVNDGHYSSLAPGYGAQDGDDESNTEVDHGKESDDIRALEQIIDELVTREKRQQQERNDERYQN